MSQGLVMQAYEESAASLPHWNPYAGTGQPILADPENVGLHPAFAVGVRGGWRGGWHSLALFHMALLVLGLGLLGRVIGVPAVVAGATAVLLFTSYEWVHRLSSGHATIIGIAAWPAAVGLALHALRQTRRPRRALLLGAAAGLVLGSAGLAGGHYALPMGLMLLAWVVWAEGAGRGPALGLAALLWLPLVAKEGPAAVRVVFELAALFLVGFGAWRSQLRRTQGACLAGAALGVMGVAGAKLYVGSVASAPFGRLIPWSWESFATPAPELTADNLFYFGRIESYLHLPHPVWWLLALLGAAGLLIRAPGLGTAIIAFVAAAWTSGAAWRPSLFITLLPGSAAMAEHLRFQHVVLLFPALGLLSAVVEGGARWGHRRVGLIACSLLGVAAMAWVQTHPQTELPVAQSPPEDVHAAAPRVFVDAPDRAMSKAPGAGEVRARTVTFHYGTMAPPAAAGDRLIWTIADGEFAPAGDDVSVEAELNRWRIRATGGAVVAVAQRDAPGWSCEGGERVLDAEFLTEDYGRIDDADPSRTPDPNNLRPRELDSGERWLTVRMGPDGEVACVWRTPGLRLGLLAQAFALMLLLGLGVIEARSPSAADEDGTASPEVVDGNDSAS